MDQKRRKKVQRIAEQLKEFSENIDAILSEVDFLAEEEKYCYDNMPDSFSDTDRYKKLEENIDGFDAVCDEFIDIKRSLNVILESLGDITS